MTISSLHAGYLTLSTQDEVPSHSPRNASLDGAPSTAAPASMVDRRRPDPSRRTPRLTGDERIAEPPPRFTADPAGSFRASASSGTRVPIKVGLRTEIAFLCRKPRTQGSPRRAACGRHDSIHPQIHGELTVMIRGMPDGECRES